MRLNRKKTASSFSFLSRRRENKGNVPSSQEWEMEISLREEVRVCCHRELIKFFPIVIYLSAIKLSPW